MKNPAYIVTVHANKSATVECNGVRVATVAGPARVWSARHDAALNRRTGFVCLSQEGTRLNVGSCQNEHFPAAIEAIAAAF